MKNVFVFPCGSEIALEIARSVAADQHFHLIGGASVRDHGRFVYDDLEEDVPWLEDDAFIPCVSRIVKQRGIDLIYPATDMAAVVLKRAEKLLGCYVITSPIETAEICLSKKLTYMTLGAFVRVPRMYSADDRIEYPIFVKPEVGHSSRGATVVHSKSEQEVLWSKNPRLLLLELLPGDEYTVDCFSDKEGRLLFSGARLRARTSNGISVHTQPVSDAAQAEFTRLVSVINDKLNFRGAWFAQFKRDCNGCLVLLEIAARFGGSSGLYRGLGVNFALLTLWDALGSDVSIAVNKYTIEMDRALDNRYELGIKYDEVFLDYDDTVVMSATGHINPKVMQFVFSCINRGVRVSILSKHRGNLPAEMRQRNIDGLFSRIIHVPEEADKSDYIDNNKAIFIDDSYSERVKVLSKCRIPVFGLDMVDALCDS